MSKQHASTLVGAALLLGCAGGGEGAADGSAEFAGTGGAAAGTSGGSNTSGAGGRGGSDGNTGGTGPGGTAGNGTGGTGAAGSGGSSGSGGAPVATALEQAATAIGRMYDCPLAPNLDYIAGNLGYSFEGDEQAYAAAKLLLEKGCLDGVEKYVIAYVSTLNFPSNGTATGAGSGVEERWLRYWAYLMDRFSALGFKVIVHPLAFILSDGGVTNKPPPGLRWLVRDDLNLQASDVPVVYECKDGRQTVVASIYDSRTLAMGETFYQGVADFFSPYPAFTKVSIAVPSDFGEYGFPFGVTGGWWQGSANVGNCYLTGDEFARAVAPANPPTYAQYDGRLNTFRTALAAYVKSLFPSRRTMIYMGYGSDGAKRDGFQYEEVVNYCVANGIDLHSAHATGINAAEVPLDDIALNKPNNYREFTFENAGLINEQAALKNLALAWKYQVTGIEAYPSFLLDTLFTAHLHHSMGRQPNAGQYDSKAIVYEDVSGLGALRSEHLTQGYIDSPVEAATVDGDAKGIIGGWAFYEAPYGDRLGYKIYVYAGHVYEQSPYPPDMEHANPIYDTGSANKLHPQFMRLVASTTTNGERAVGLGDTSRFGVLWKPNLSSGKAVLRLFVENSESEILAEHPASPRVINVESRITGSYGIARMGYTSDHCSRRFRIQGNVVDADTPSAPLDIVIVDEYRGRVVTEGQSDASGDFDLRFDVPESVGEETQHLSFRAYVYVDNDGDQVEDLVALRLDMSDALSPGAGGYNTVGNKFLTVLNCNLP